MPFLTFPPLADDRAEENQPRNILEEIVWHKAAEIDRWRCGVGGDDGGCWVTHDSICVHACMAPCHSSPPFLSAAACWHTSTGTAYGA